MWTPSPAAIRSACSSSACSSAAGAARARVLRFVCHPPVYPHSFFALSSSLDSETSCCHAELRPVSGARGVECRPSGAAGASGTAAHGGRWAAALDEDGFQGCGLCPCLEKYENRERVPVAQLRRQFCSQRQPAKKSCNNVVSDRRWLCAACGALFEAARCLGYRWRGHPTASEGKKKKLALARPLGAPPLEPPWRLRAIPKKALGFASAMSAIDAP